MRYPIHMVGRASGCILAVALMACGGSTIVDGGSGGSGGASSSSSSSTAGGGAPGGSGGAGSGGSSEGQWRADAWIGQIDHLGIRHLDTDADVCVLINASAPGGMGAYDVTIPDPWAVHAISAWDQTDGCMDEQFTPADPSLPADMASGSISFAPGPMAPYPCELDVDILVQFANPPAWLPATLELKTTMLEVGGVCP